MSGDDMQTVREAFRAFEERDQDALLSHLDPDVHWHPTAFLTGTASYRGHDGVKEWLAAIAELEKAGSHVITSPVEFREVGEGRVLVLGAGSVVRGHGTLKRDLGWIWELSGGKVVRMVNYPSEEEAEAAAEGRDSGRAGRG